MVSFTIYGKPQPKQRPRVLKTGITYTPKDTLLYEANVRQVALNSGLIPQSPVDYPVKMILWCYFEIPVSWSKKKREQAKKQAIYPTMKYCGDVDNLAKVVMDACNNLVYKDDSQVVELVIHKQFDEQPRVEVLIDRI